jgi:hypothetical protein
MLSVLPHLINGSGRVIVPQLASLPQLQDAPGHGLLVDLGREHLAGMHEALAIHVHNFKFYVHGHLTQ